MLAHIFFLTLVISTLGAQYKVENSTHIHCLKEANNINDVAYISPPLEEVLQIENLLNDATWAQDNWKIAFSNQSSFVPIKDRRWEEFSVIKDTVIKKENVSSFTFSVYGFTNFDTFSDAAFESEYKRECANPNDFYSWTTYDFGVIDNFFYVFKNNVLTKTIYDFLPQRFLLRSGNTTYWKVHDYQLLQSDKPTKNEPVVLKVTPNKAQLTLFSSLCDQCILNVTVNYKNGTNHFVEIKYQNNDSNNIKKDWDQTDIFLNINEEHNITFTKHITNDSASGFWALDLRFYDDKLYKTTYVKTNMSTNHTCKYFTKSERISELHEDNCNKIGSFGPNCQFDCKNITGDDYCKGHKICIDEQCSCAWGYYGQNCTLECGQGTWGKHCENKCVTCKNCNRIDGSCSSNGGERKRQETLLLWFLFCFLFGYVTKSNV